MARRDPCIRRLQGSRTQFLLTLSSASKFLSHIKTRISFKIRWRRRQRGRQKSDRFNIQNNFSCALRFFVRTFLCPHCTTMTWKCLISRFTEEVQPTTKFLLYFWTWIWFLGIQLYEGSPTFDKVSTCSIKSRWRLKEREFTFSATFSLPSPSSDLKVRGMELRLLLEWTLRN